MGPFLVLLLFGGGLGYVTQGYGQHPNPPRQLTLGVADLPADAPPSLRKLIETSGPARMPLYKETIKYYLGRDINQALRFARHYLQEAEVLQDPHFLADAHNLIGVVYDIQDLYVLSLPHFLDGLRISQSIQDTAKAINCLNNIGLVYMSIRDYLGADSILRQSMALSWARRDTQNYSIALHNLGSVLLSLGEYADADRVIRETLRLKESVTKPDSLSIMSTVQNLVLLHLNQDGWERALFLVDALLDFHQRREDNYSVGQILGLRGQALLQKGAVAEAEASFERAMDLAHETQNHYGRENLYLQLARLHEKRGNWPKALDYQRKAHALADSLRGADVHRQLAAAQTAYGVESREQQIILLEEQARNAALRLWMLIGGAVLSLVVLGLLYRHQRARLMLRRQEAEQAARLAAEREKVTQLELENSRLENERLGQDVAYRGQQLQQLALQVLEKNELLEQVREQLRERVAAADPNATEAIRNLTQQIQTHLHLDRDREEFQAYIEQVNEGFFQKLTERFPDLTQNELRLCSLLRLQFSSKDIAQLLNLSPRTVDTYRHTLRRKLQMEGDTNLTEFLASL